MRSTEFWQIMRRQVRTLIVLTVGAVSVAGFLNLASKPMYTASTSVVARNLLTILKPLKFEELATSTSVAAHVRDELGLKESAQELARRVKSTAGQSALYRVSVSDPVPDRAVRIVNAISLEAARMYTDLAVGTPEITVNRVDDERAAYRQRYQAAAQRLLDFEAAHPDVMVGSLGSEALPPDLQGQVLAQAGSPPLQPLPPQMATTDVRVESQFLALQLSARLAADAYHNFEAETAKNWVAAVGNAHDYGAEVVDHAVVAEPDTAARRWRVVYAAFLGLLLGIGTALLRERLQGGMRAPGTELIGSGEPLTGGAVSAVTR
jgi:hypothetical protein